MFERTANKRLKKKLGDRYRLIEPAITLDPHGGKGYAGWVARWLAATESVDDHSLFVAASAIADIDAVLPTLRGYGVLGTPGTSKTDDAGNPVKERIDPTLTSVEPSIEALEARRYRLMEEADSADPTPRFRVLSPNVVETCNFAAAKALHGIDAPASRRTDWCGGKTLGNFRNYGSSDRRRYVVFPNGPDEEVEIAGQVVPWSSDAAVFSIRNDGAIGNVNDANNVYRHQSGFNWKQAKAAAEKLSAALHMTVDIGSSEEYEDENEAEVWENAGLDRDEWVAAGITNFEEAEAWNAADISPKVARVWISHGFENASAVRRFVRSCGAQASAGVGRLYAESFIDADGDDAVLRAVRKAERIDSAGWLVPPWVLVFKLIHKASGNFTSGSIAPNKVLALLDDQHFISRIQDPTHYSVLLAVCAEDKPIESAVAEADQIMASVPSLTAHDEGASAIRHLVITYLKNGHTDVADAQELETRARSVFENTREFALLQQAVNDGRSIDQFDGIKSFARQHLGGSVETALQLLVRFSAKKWVYAPRAVFEDPIQSAALWSFARVGDYASDALDWIKFGFTADERNAWRALGYSGPNSVTNRTEWRPKTTPQDSRMPEDGRDIPRQALNALRTRLPEQQQNLGYAELYALFTQFAALLNVPVTQKLLLAHDNPITDTLGYLACQYKYLTIEDLMQYVSLPNDARAAVESYFSARNYTESALPGRGQDPLPAGWGDRVRQYLATNPVPNSTNRYSGMRGLAAAIRGVPLPEDPTP